MSDSDSDTDTVVSDSEERMGEARAVGIIGSLFQYTEDHNWTEYIEIYEHYFTANSINEDKLKVSILCSNVGPKTYHVIKNLCLPNTPSEKTFKELTKLVKNHFKPKLSEASSSLHFNTRIRKKDESVRVFVAELRRLATGCNFGQYLDRALRDRFIAGINDEVIQEKILSLPDDDLTFDSAYKIADAHEAACRNVKEMQRQSSSSAESVHKMKSGYKTSKYSERNRDKPAREKEKYRDGAKRDKEKHRDGAKRDKEKTNDCHRCGLKHNPSICWYRNKDCFACGRRGHTKMMCRKQSVKHVEESDNSDRDSESDRDVYSDEGPYGMSHLREEIATDSDDDLFWDREQMMFHVNDTVNRIRDTAITVEILIGEQEVAFELDTGSPYTMISEETLEKIKRSKEVKVKESQKNVRSFTGHAVTISGEAEAKMRYKNRIIEGRMLITPLKPNLLGRDIIKELDIITVNRLEITENSLQEVLSAHTAVFKDELGKLKGITAKIHVDPNASPIFCKARTVPYAMRSRVEEELRRLEDLQVIESVRSSEWAAPIVPVLKPSGQIRICGDYKVTVNKVSKLEQYPIPTLAELTTKLEKGSKYHKLDLSHAYSQVELDEDSRKYVTINTHRGMFQYTRLPFGVSSAPAIFQRVIESVLEGIPSVAIYMDDILVTGKTPQDSLVNLNKVLSSLENAGLRLRKDKCEFMKDEVTYLGHRINKTGTTPVSEKVKAIVNFQVPGNVTQLKAFLGLLNYYGQYLENLSSVLNPLHKLLKKDIPFVWRKSQQDSFEKVKRMITTKKVLVHYSPELPMILQCDASPYGLGAVLSHTMPDGSERPIGFTSRTLNPAEKNYSQLDKEGAAVIFGLKKFHKYVYGRTFNIVTDHKPLLTLFHEEKPIPALASPRIQRWGIILRAYEYKMVYKPGKEHSNADCLSRLPLKVTEPIHKEDVVFLLDELEDCSVLTAKDIKQWTKYDPVMSRVYGYIMSGWPDVSDPELSAYSVRKEELSVHEGCILWGMRVVVPPKGRHQVLKELHTAHPGVSRMKALARSYVWYPSMDMDIEKLVKSCETCQQQRKSPPVAPLHPWEYPDGPWQRVHIDYAGPFKGAMFLIIVDAYSKWIDVYMMTSTTSADTINRLRECFAQHGIPKVLVSDNAANFRSETFQNFMRSNGITHSFVSPFHPAGNIWLKELFRLSKKPSKRLKVMTFTQNFRRSYCSTTSPPKLQLERVLQSF